MTTRRRACVALRNKLCNIAIGERIEMATQVSMLVGGQPYETLSTFERRNPVTGEVASTAPAATVDDARAAADAAAAAFPAWSALGPNARRALLMKAATALEAKVPQFVVALLGVFGASVGWVW